MYCLWLSRDEDDTAGKTQNNLTLETTGPNQSFIIIRININCIFLLIVIQNSNTYFFTNS